VERGLDQLLGALERRNGDREDIRRMIVGILDSLGSDSELARDARRRLATALY
jgi:putative thioredoxin